MEEKELHVTISLNTFHRLGGKDHTAYFVNIKGIGRFKHALSYHTKREAEAIVTEMARNVAQIYMAESKSREGRSPLDMGDFGKKPYKSKKR
jgi:hypothetical protein